MRRKMEDQQKQKEEAMKAAKEMQVIVWEIVVLI